MIPLSRLLALVFVGAALLAGPSSAAHIPAASVRHTRDVRIERSFVRMGKRQNATPSSSAVTAVETMHQTTVMQTDEGTETYDCTVVLTPITTADGPATQEDQSCSVSFQPGAVAPANSPAVTLGVDGLATPVASSGSPTMLVVPPSAAASDMPSPSMSDSNAMASPSVTGSDGVTVIGTSTIAVSSMPTASSASGSMVSSGSTSDPSAMPTSGPSSPSGDPNAAASGPSPSSASSASSPSANAAGTAALATAPSVSPAAAAANALPGQTIQVLPIGLGVFAGITVIALIVVGIVTFERTRYRKAFRARKLAEQGGVMGYGGMAERA